MRRLISFFILSTLSCCAFASDVEVNLFDKFNTYCIAPGPDFDEISKSLISDGAVRLPDQAGIAPDDPDKISGFLFADESKISVMISRSGRCAITAPSVDQGATMASLEEMLSVWKGRAEVTELPLDHEGLLAANRIDFAHVMMTINLFTSAHTDGSKSIILSREIYTK